MSADNGTLGYGSRIESRLDLKRKDCILGDRPGATMTTGKSKLHARQ